jgi:hypothetical protein
MTDRPRDPGLLIQIHIPRCAGTSIGNWLRNAALQGVLSGFGAIYPDDFVLENERDFLAAGFADPRLTAVTTHNIRKFPATIAGRNAHYFSLLREPLEHVLSYVRYMRQERLAFDLPANLSEETRDITAWLLGRSLDSPFRENPQTNHLALYTWCAATSGRCEPATYGRWSSADQHAYWNERLDVAKDVLRSFLCVGTVERMNETIQLLRERSHAVGIELLPAEQMVHVNTTSHDNDDLSWTDANDPLGRQLRESLAVDVELYRFANEMLDRVTGGVPRAHRRTSTAGPESLAPASP